MAAREEILRLMNLYCYTIDTGDLEGWAGLFEHGEWGVEGAQILAGKEQLLDSMKNVYLYEDGTPRTKHCTTNIELEINEAAGTAKGQCYITLFQQTKDFPLQAIFAGHYFDDFERVNGAWRFKKRLIRHPLVGDTRAHVKPSATVLPK